VMVVSVLVSFLVVVGAIFGVFYLKNLGKPDTTYPSPLPRLPS
jgi:hypothetical protein